MQPGSAIARPPRRALAVAALLAGCVLEPALARADAEEASLHAHALGGLARLGDSLANTTNTAPLFGLAGRFTYATSDYFAYEARLALAQTGKARFANVTYEEDTGDLERATRFALLTAGVTARLGVRYIPTLHVSTGVQARQLISGVITDPTYGGEPVATVGDDTALSFVVSGALGFDYRVNRRLIVGVNASATHAFGGPAFDALSGTAHVAYYWYPRW